MDNDKEKGTDTRAGQDEDRKEGKAQDQVEDKDTAKDRYAGAR